MAQTGVQSGLGALAGQMPVRSREMAEQQKAARAIQLRQAIARMAPGQAPTREQAAQLGATAAAQAGAEQVAAAQQGVETIGQMARLGQQEAALTGAKRLGEQQQAVQREQLGQLDRLANLDARAKKELFDNELAFRKDAANQTFFSERQLADYKRQSAVSDEQFKNWANTAQNAHRRNVASLEAIYNKLAEVEKNNFRIGEQKLDQAAKEELIKLKVDTEKRLAKAKKDAANTAMMWQAGGMIVGGALGALTMTPQGVMAGASLGGAAGGTIGAQQSGQERV